MWTPAMPSPTYTLRLPESLTRDLERRAPYLGGGAGVVRTDLGRSRALVRDAQSRLAREGVFSAAEGAVILDALNGTLLADRPETLAASVEDAMRLDGLAEKWGVDAGGLSEKLRSLTPLEFHAIADRAETFWASVGSKEGLAWDVEEGLFGGAVGR